MRLMVSFVSDESGATAIEYGVLAALVAALAVPALSIVGAGLSDALAEISAKLTPSPDIRCRDC